MAENPRRFGKTSDLQQFPRHFSRYEKRLPLEDLTDDQIDDALEDMIVEVGGVHQLALTGFGRRIQLATLWRIDPYKRATPADPQEP